jgi:hypothetical protein
MGSSQLDGSVEICVNGLWGRVCGNIWNYLSATVVCRQLGQPLGKYASKSSSLHACMCLQYFNTFHIKHAWLFHAITVIPYAPGYRGQLAAMTAILSGSSVQQPLLYYEMHGRTPTNQQSCMNFVITNLRSRRTWSNCCNNYQLVAEFLPLN